MFAEDFLSISLAEVLGLLVTAIGIWLVVQQLRETKLATQMEGVLSLSDRFIEITPEISLIDRVTSAADWSTLQVDEQHKQLYEDKQLPDGIRKVSKFYELVSVLFQTGSLDKMVAYKLYGLAYVRWTLVKAAVSNQREKSGVAELASEWEWLANEFEKMSG